jgi:lipopolysaccharide export system protein LptA
MKAFNKCKEASHIILAVLATLIMLPSFTVNSFAQTDYTLSVSLAGSGTITSSPAGIDCGADCSELYTAGTGVTLTAEPDAGYVFTSWSGDCAPAGNNPECVLAMDADRNVTANFDSRMTVSGNINANTTWYAENSPVYVSGDVSVTGGITLSIEPGVVVKFAQWTGLYVSGTLNVPTASGDRVYFTDYRDDTVGGDINGDDPEQSPGADWWSGITVWDGGTATIDNCEIRYAGRYHDIWGLGMINAGLLKIGAGALTLTNSTVYQTDGDAVYLRNATGSYVLTGNTITGNSWTGMVFINAGTDVTVTNNTISGNGGSGVYIENTGLTAFSGNTVSNNSQNGVYATGATFMEFSNNTITGNAWNGLQLINSSPALVANVITGNGGYGVYLDGTSAVDLSSNDNDLGGNPYGSMGFSANSSGAGSDYDSYFPSEPVYIEGGTLPASATGWSSSRPYVVRGDVTVPSGGTLSITSGAVVKFAQNTGLYVSGILNAVGAPGSRVYFTDYRDDTVGGDINGDDPEQNPGADWWIGITVWEGGAATLDNSEIRYAGRERRIYGHGLDNYFNTGLLKTGVGVLILTNSTVYQTGGNGVHLQNTTESHVITGNTITGSAWNGVAFVSAGTNITFSNNSVTGSSDNGVYIGNSSPAIHGNSIYANTTKGIYVNGAASTPVISANRIYTNNVGVYCDANASPLIGSSAENGNDIYGNTSYGVQNTSPSITVNATYNYWGSPSGPYHPVTNPSGTGDRVSDYVDYSTYYQISVFSGKPEISVSPGNIDFGGTGVGASSAQAITISNIGSANLNIYPITVIGADAGHFSIQNDLCSNHTLVPTGTCTLNAVFLPVTAGAKTAALIVRSNDSDVKTIGLTGSAVYMDNDSDGYTNDVDCNDGDPAINPGEPDDNCNGIDDNCSGEADEGYEPGPTTCEPGACAPTGQLICVGGVVRDTCINTPAPDDSTCDGLDNDCDGQTDEDYVPLTTECGIGGCSSTGQVICSGGVQVDTCTPGAPTTEGPAGDATCSDGTDNDCDMDIDSLDLGCFIPPDTGGGSGGKLLWTRQMGTSFDDAATGLAEDGNGNVYVTGYTYGGLDGNVSAGGYDLFLVKYDSAGEKKWTKQLGTAGADFAQDAAADGSGNIYITGYTYGGLDGNSNAGGYDAFLVKYNNEGTKEWTRQLGTGDSDYATGIAVDGSGNIYVTGYTYGGLDGNPNAGGSDAFLVKYDSEGVKQWTRQLGTPADDEAGNAAVDSIGNTYVTGHTQGGLDGNTNAGGRDFFLVKYNSGGVKEWTRQTGTNAEDTATGVSVDGGGNVYLTGYTYGGLNGNTNAGSADLFLVKYDGAGARQWTRQTGTASYDRANAVAVDLNGSVYVTGYTNASIDGIVYEGEEDIFIVKYTGEGVKQWTRQMGTFSGEYAEGAAVDRSGNVYIAGYTYGDLDGNSNEGGYDLFLIKYDGLYEWTRQTGTSTYDYAYATAVDGSGNIYVTGYTYGGLDGNPNSGGYDAFIVKYGSGGVKQWTRQFGTDDSDYATSLTVDGSGNVYVTGYTYGGLDGNTNADLWGLTTDLFLVKYNSAGVKQWTRQMGTDGNDESYGVAADGSGNVFITGYTEGDLDGNVSEGYKDVFIVKFDSSGVKHWTRQTGTGNDDQASAAAVDGSGNVYVTGFTDGGLDGNTNEGWEDIFLVKYDSTGAKQWTRQLGTPLFDYAYGAAVDGSGNVYVTGQTFGGLDGNTSLQNYDLFLVKYDSSGVKQWTKQMGTSSWDSGHSAAVDGSGNIYIAGYTYGTLEGHIGAAGDDFILVMYNSNGELQWTRQMGTDTNDRAYGVAVDGSGSVYITGGSRASFDGQFYAGDHDMVLVKYNVSSDTAPPTGSVIINSGETIGNSASVILGLDCSDPGGCREMKFSNNNSLWSDPKAYSVTRTWDLTAAAYGGTAGDGAKTVYVKFMDNTGNWSTAYSDDIILDTALPTGTVKINSGDAYTDSTLVMLDITGSDVNGISEMQFSNDGTNWSTSETYNTVRAWLLSSGDGTKTVSARLKDNAGNWSDPFNDTIILDQTAPVTTPDNPGTLYQTAQTVTLTCDDGAGSGCADTYYCLGTGCNPVNLYNAPFTFSENTTLRYYSKDTLGNTEAVQEDVYTFVQTATDLSIELSAPRILSGGTVDAVGQLLRIPEDGESRNGLTVRFEITGPSPTPPATETVTYTDSGLYSHTISGFIAEGIYDIKAVFDGNGLLLPDESPVMSVYVGPSAGYAIIVEGKIPSGAGLDSHNKTANRIYAKLKARGFDDSDIYYFNYDTGPDGVDEAPTKVAVETAVKYWAKFKMNDIAAPLYIIMTDHGNSTDGIYLESESITPADLDTWLDTLEGGLNAAALQKKRIVMVGACYSGAFIPAVSKSGRVVISSSAADEVSHKGPYENDSGVEIRSGEFFMEELFTFLERGETIREAFIRATERTEIFTRRDSVSGEVPPYYDEAVQHPLLDDDGDGYGSNVLSGTGDGDQVKDLYLGVGNYYVPNRATNPAEVTRVTEPAYLTSAPGDNTYTMWADVNDNAKVDGGRIWFEVRTPSKTLSGTGGNEQAVADYVYNFLLYDSGLRWEKTYNTFDEYGRYEIFYFVRDAETQQVSPMKRSIVYKDSPANLNYPGAFNLTSPADDSEQMKSVILDWEESVDPDGDEVTYTVMISEDSTFTTVDYIMTDIKNTWVLVGENGELSDLATYYWKVVAVDPYGKHTESNQVWSFHPNSCNDPANCNGTELPGIITGYIYVSGTNPKVPVAGASIMTSDGRSATSGANGFYSISNHNPGTWNISVTHEPDHEPASSSVSVTSLKVTEKDLYMAPSCTPATEVCDGIDNDCDGLIDDNDPDVTGQSTWHPDTDGDGYGSTSVSITQCIQAAGNVADNTDCDDSDEYIYPGGPEVRIIDPPMSYYWIYELQTAYNDAQDLETIQGKAATYTGNLAINQNKTVTIEGGYTGADNCGFTSVTGKTTVNGNVTISNGTVKIVSGTLEVQ